MSVVNKKKKPFQCTLHPGAIKNKPARRPGVFCCSCYENAYEAARKQAIERKARKAVEAAEAAPPENRPVLAMDACEADKARLGGFACLTLTQACDAIAALADCYIRDPDDFCRKFFGQHVAAARKRRRLEAGEER